MPWGHEAFTWQGLVPAVPLQRPELNVGGGVSRASRDGHITTSTSACVPAQDAICRSRAPGVVPACLVRNHDVLSLCNQHLQGISCGHSAAVGSQLRRFALPAWSPLEVLCVEVATFFYSFYFTCSSNVLPVIVFVLVFVSVSVLVCGGVLQALQVHSGRVVPWN